MHFEPATEFSLNYFQYWVSSENKWEIGFTQMMFGVRVRFGQRNSPCCEVDYCAGPVRELQTHLMQLIKTILLEVPESVDLHALRTIFPHQRIKPMVLDAELYALLAKKADEALNRLAAESKAS